MAFSGSNLPFKLFSSFVLFLFTAFFLLPATKAKSQKKVSFNFTKFSYGQSDLTFQGSTYIYVGDFLALPDPTRVGPNVGRVLYSNLVPIWDSSTGNVADFETSFTFEVWTGDMPGHGLVFFLTNPENAKIPNNSGEGTLGVADAKNAFNHFVGVEFDNFANPWDPNYAHVGINLNSLYSVKIMPWRWSIFSLVKVKIIYSSLSSTLTVIVTNEDGQTSTLSQMIDLKWLLPEMAVVGISGSSGIFQEHAIFSWSFTSILDTTTRSSSDNTNKTTASY